MSEMQFDFDGLIQLLANNLYSEKKVFIRELIQNCHDAIQRRAAADPDFSVDMGRIDIYTDLGGTPATIKFCDNGVGMTKPDLENYLSSVGASGTRTNKEEAPDVIGQFGIGFLSGFVVAKKIVVRTKSWKESKNDGWLWENEGRKEYLLESNEKKELGTEVTIFLASAEDNGLVQDKAIREVIHTYADMLKIPIYLNYSETSINTRIMPWERKEISEDERDIDCRVYLEKNMPDSVLEVIPLDEVGDINISGVLYITRTRVIGRDTPRTIRVFQKRMFLCESTPEVLPRWAGFVNGIFNTSNLNPNAARDNFQRDEHWVTLRDRLGEIIIAHFDKLKENNQERLSEILAYHDLQIKAACHYYDAFFEKFGHLLEWKVNSQSPAALNNKTRMGGRNTAMFDDAGEYAWVTLPDLVAALPKPEGDGLIRLNCFTSHSSANQFFEMANAAGSSVLDASASFETELIKTWASNHPNIRLVYVDREDDPTIFQEIDINTDKKVQELANQMSLYIRLGGTGRIRVEARCFEPKALPAVLKSSPESSGSNKANEILNDPNSPASLRVMAEEMKRLAHNADIRMTINATNPLIRQLSALDDYEDPEVIDLMGGIYNDAILYNQEMMTPSNAKVFHQQYGRLLHRAVEYLQQRDQLKLYQEAERQQSVQPHKHQHKIAFYMTPFHQSFSCVREAVRIVVEDKLGCQLLTADQITYEELIKGNVRQHIDGADFYIADVTGANPNVMQELGAVHYGRSASPTLLIAGLESGQKTLELPADLQGHIASDYQQGETSIDIAEKLLPDFQANQRLKQLLDDSEREPYLSPATLKNYTDDILRDPNNYQRLSQKYSTASAWKEVSEPELENILNNESDLASVVLKRVRSKLEAMA